MGPGCREQEEEVGRVQRCGAVRRGEHPHGGGGGGLEKVATNPPPPITHHLALLSWNFNSPVPKKQG